MQGIYNRIEVAFANADLSIFEKQNLMPLYNTLNERMYEAWDQLPQCQKDNYHFLLYEGENESILSPTYSFRKKWVEQNLEKEEYRPLIEGFKAYYGGKG